MLMGRNEESGIIWYKSLETVQKQEQEDKYGEKGEGIHIYARCCLSSDIEHKKGDCERSE